MPFKRVKLHNLGHSLLKNFDFWLSSENLTSNPFQKVCSNSPLKFLFQRSSRLTLQAEALLMSIHNILCFCGEIRKKQQHFLEEKSALSRIMYNHINPKICLS